MLSTSMTVFADGHPSFKVAVELDVNDILPTKKEEMPVSVSGTIVGLSAEDQEKLKGAKDVRVVFAGTEFNYGAAINRDTWEFRAIDTSERGY